LVNLINPLQSRSNGTTPWEASLPFSLWCAARSVRGNDFCNLSYALLDVN